MNQRLGFVQAGSGTLRALTHMPNRLNAMSKSLRVVFEDEELEEIRRVARARRMTVAEWVRQSLRQAHGALLGVLVSALVLAPSCGGEAMGSEESVPAVPGEVVSFVERRDLCEHSRGEEPYDEERRRFVEERLRESCSGIDAELIHLLETYRGHPAALALLSDYPAVLDCQFIPVEFAEDELAACAFVNLAGQLVMLPTTVLVVRARSSEPVAAVVGSTLYYLNGAGRSAPVLSYDNGADYFEEGLARTVRGGKVGFIDHDLRERIEPAWDFAFPFSNGFALVCQGCRGHSVGEHEERRGGRWGYINRDGEVVVPVEFERRRVPPPVD